MNSELNIRPAASDDAEALLEIYTPYVMETAITFEYEVPSKNEFTQRISFMKALTTKQLLTLPNLVTNPNNGMDGKNY